MKYSYIIYKIYTWTANKPGETPVANTVLTLAVVHFFQFLTVFLYLNAFFFHARHLFAYRKGHLFLAAIAWFILLHFLIYNKERWAGYVQQYHGEDAHASKVGDYQVLAFCAGSILAFFVSLPVAFTLLRHFQR